MTILDYEITKHEFFVIARLFQIEQLSISKKSMDKNKKGFLIVTKSFASSH
jgi:hypothetical protein